MGNVAIFDDTSSIHAIGDYILEYSSRQNAFLGAMVNRIARVLVTSKVWSNPWAVFKKGRMEYGETVEEIFANIANPHSFDPVVAESNLYKREIPDVRAAFHTMNFQKFYKVTVSHNQLRQAFLSYGELSDLIARIVDTLYTGMQLDEYLVMKYMVCREALNGGIYLVGTPAISGDGADPEGVVELFREYTNNLTFLKTTFNRAGVRNSTPVSEQVIIVPNKAESVLGVKVLANAFNIDEVDYIGNRIAVDSFSFDTSDMARLAEIFENDKDYKEFTDTELKTLETIMAMKLDMTWIMCFDNFEQFTENYNGQGLYWQYFFHAWKTFSVSPFANAVLFSTSVGSATSVTVSPAESTAKAGDTVKFTSKVTGKGFFNSTVTYSIEAGDGTELSTDTSINALTGELEIGKHQGNGTIKVIASNANVNAAAIVTVS